MELLVTWIGFWWDGVKVSSSMTDEYFNTSARRCSIAIGEYLLAIIIITGIHDCPDGLMANKMK